MVLSQGKYQKFYNVIVKNGFWLTTFNKVS